MIPKFELYRVKIDDFTSAEIWTILTWKWPGDWVKFIAKYYLLLWHNAGVNSFVYAHWFLTRRETGACTPFIFPLILKVSLLGMPAMHYLPPQAFSFAPSAILYPTLRQRLLSHGILTTRFEQPFCRSTFQLSALVKSSRFTLDSSNFGIFHFKRYIL